MFKIGDKVVFGRKIPVPQTFHVGFVEGKEVHASPGFLLEYIVAFPGGQ